MRVTKGMRRIAESAAASIEAQIEWSKQQKSMLEGKSIHDLMIAEDRKRRTARTRRINVTLDRIVFAADYFARREKPDHENLDILRGNVRRILEDVL
jgi:hypothetical protein